MWLRKRSTPGSAPGGLHWDSPDDVVEVPDELAQELLEFQRHEFSEAPAPADKDAEAEPAKRRTRSSKTTDTTTEVSE